MQIHFDKLYNREREKEPCYVSIPFAKGTLTDSDSLSLSQDGNILPLQTKISCRDHNGNLYNATSDAICLSDYVFEVLGNPQSSPCRTCVASSNYRTNYHTNEAGEEVSLEIDADWLINEGNEHFAEVFYGTFFADITTQDAGITGTIYQAYQNFPKAVKASTQISGDQTVGKLSMYLIPAGASVCMQSGMARYLWRFSRALYR